MNKIILIANHIMYITRKTIIIIRSLCFISDFKVALKSLILSLIAKERTIIPTIRKIIVINFILTNSLSTFSINPIITQFMPILQATKKALLRFFNNFVYLVAIFLLICQSLLICNSCER